MNPPQEMAGPPPRPNFKRSWLGCVGILIAFAFLSVIPPLGWFVVPAASNIWAWVGTRLNFSCNQAMYARVVELIDKDGLSPNDNAFYRIPLDWDQKTLTRGNPYASSELQHARKGTDRWVWAWRESNGTLIVTFTTYDLGHYGAHGLLYASKDLTELEVRNRVSNCGSASQLKRGWWAYVGGD
jgi:hypothetical protein